MTTKDTARSFSGRLLAEAFPHGNETSNGGVVEACLATVTRNAHAETTWLRGPGLGLGVEVAVDAFGRYAGPDKEASKV